MRPRRYADLIAFVREACTHASKNEREISAGLAAKYAKKL